MWIFERVGLSTRDVMAELRAFGLTPMVHNAESGPEAAAHKRYMADIPTLVHRIRPGGVLVDLRSCLDPTW